MTTPNQTRAVLRPILIGAAAKCEKCEKTLRGNFKYRPQQIIVNQFKRRKWVATKHYCTTCYDDLGRPYGEVMESTNRAAHVATSEFGQRKKSAYGTATHGRRESFD